jgi:GPI mannosyltransferase 3
MTLPGEPAMLARPMSPLPPTPATSPRLAAPLAALCIASFLVKLGAYLLWPNLGNPDETFQYLEQTHRVVYGTGLVPWDVLVGIRSWLLPGLLVPGMALARLLGAGPESFLAGNAALLALLSLAAVICGTLWGRRASGTAGGMIAGALNAFWFESVYYATHVLAEAVAADFLVAGLFLGYPGAAAKTPKRLVLAGLCLGAAAVLRLQLGPAVAVALIFLCGRRPRAWLAAVAGALGPTLLLGAVDWATLGQPFQSVTRYIEVNYLADAASQFGTDPWYQYLVWEGGYWWLAALLILPLAGFGARRLPLLLLVALVIIGMHMAVPHKEPRFIFPAIPLLLTLVGIGSAEVLTRVSQSRPAVIGALGALCWIAVSAELGSAGYFAAYWRVGAGMAMAQHLVDARASSCGLAIYPRGLWWRSGGYTRLRPGVTFYGLDPDQPDAPARSRAFTDIVTTGDGPDAPQPNFTGLGFARAGCWDNGQNRTPICLWRREGGCDAGADTPLVANIPENLDPVVRQLQR